MSFTRAQIPAIIWTLFIATSCLLPASAFKDFSLKSLLELDKLIHFTLFFVLVILWGIAANTQTSVSTMNKIILFVVAVGYGVLVEFIQSTTNYGRSYELGDIIANTIGSLFGVLSLEYLFKKMPLIKKHLPFIQKLY